MIPAASANYADVVAAVKLAVDGDTVLIPSTLTLPGGVATWTQSLNVYKGITIMGAGATSTIIVNNILGLGSNAQALINLYDTGADKSIYDQGPDVLRRVTGIGIKSNTITNIFGSKQGVGVSTFGYGSMKRIDHCQFDDLYSGVFVHNSNGVSDHNYYYNVAIPFRHGGYGHGQIGRAHV